MGYSREVYDSAKAKLERRRNDSQAKASNLRERMINKHPRIREIERDMASAAIRVAQAVLDGGDVDKAVEKIKTQNLSLQAELAELLSKEGIHVPNFEPRFTCPVCKDTGYANRRMCECFKALLREEAFNRISYMGMMKDCSFETLRLDCYPNTPDSCTGVVPRKKMKEVLSFCRSYADDFDMQSPSLLLRGATGTGKTHVSLAIARQAIDRGFGVIYSPVQKLLHQLEKEHFGRAQGNSEDIMLECDLLILDDLGTEFSSAFYISCLYNLINSRMLDGRPTIISTNLDQNELTDMYGEQISSRVIGTFVPLVFLGRDIRQISARDKIQRTNSF
ncbi:MAG: ATP-binding protein [Oscillospiraceae bacterium]|nr:ATP-binding protein [Oscillospiraceae bacterium]MDD3832880.1 ATP-binding protein [Oscillospiraceae bacterium]MDD4546347.1 ATP-binding protein [Oscillospiraceae bacterium]